MVVCSSRSVPPQDPRSASSGPDIEDAILVVDDSTAFRRFLVRALNLFGYQTLEADSCDEMEKVLERSTPAAILLDWNLGDDDPQLRLERLQELGIPLVIITGDPESLTAQPVPVLDKPLHLESLRSVLREILPT